MRHKGNDGPVAGMDQPPSSRVAGAACHTNDRYCGPASATRGTENEAVGLKRTIRTSSG